MYDDEKNHADNNKHRESNQDKKWINVYGDYG